MAASLTSILTGSWLTGPILGKELRMASRRRRHYVVRFLYLMVLVLMISLFWMQVGNYHTSAVSYLNQMSEIGRVMTLMIEWFQFVLCPIIAGVMLSTAISDEVYHKTLGVLMTTPITSLQVVMGKLLGKLLQMLLLMAMSLPLLAVIRVFGGIPWMFLISSFCLTLCLVLLAGSLSLWLSISQRRAYIVIIQGILCFVVAFGLVPFLAFLFGHRAIGERALVEFFLVTNPYFCMAGCTEQMIVPGGHGHGSGRALVDSVWPVVSNDLVVDGLGHRAGATPGLAADRRWGSDFSKEGQASRREDLTGFEREVAYDQGMAIVVEGSTHSGIGMQTMEKDRDWHWGRALVGGGLYQDRY